MIMKGAKVLIECLKEQGIDTIWGYPGGTILDIFDELYNNEDVKNILAVHEQGATHSADGYARSKGKVGVVLVTSGPGASNTVTGIATAFMDSIPLVVITGQVARPQLGKASFQELDIVEIARSITKKTYKVMDPNRLPHIIREAFQVAREGIPGPVVVDIPKDIQQSNVDYYREKISFERHVPIITSCNLKKINEIVKFIKASEKPVILSGGGIINSDAELELKGLAEKMKIPVASSLMGLGGFSGDHPLFMGMAGMHGAQCANYALSKCDLILALRTRFSDRVVCKRDGFAPNAKIVHIDIDPLEFGKNVVPKITLSGDLKYILREINSKLIEKKVQLGMHRKDFLIHVKLFQLTYHIQFRIYAT
ncbi:thiamine pyrophosphate-binding protein [Clostridium sp. UBA3061]|uniref:thiamine pyrophosphate-binding protein n=1 Tax=Clostridium sp. UBA3061 TaxID=1946353 RepID=UPI0032175896